MPSATITSKGQVTIPRRIRDLLRLEPGDRIDFVIDDQGRVLVRPGTTDVTELRGLLQRRGRRPVTLKQMTAAVARHHGRRA
jgi:AbrB family looped-hinge helix DNA binding protein